MAMRWQVFHDSAGGHLLSMVLKVLPQSDPEAIETAMRNRFDIPGNMLLILCDKDGCDVAIDGSNPSGTYELSAVHQPSTERMVQTFRSRRLDLDVASSRFGSAQRDNEARTRAIADLLDSEEAYIGTLRTIEELYLAPDDEAQPNRCTHTRTHTRLTLSFAFPLAQSGAQSEACARTRARKHTLFRAAIRRPREFNL